MTNSIEETHKTMSQDTQSNAADGPASKARLRLWLRLLKGQRKIENRLREKLRDDYGSTLPRFDVLAALSREPEGLKMSQLSGVLRHGLACFFNRIGHISPPVMGITAPLTERAASEQSQSTLAAISSV
jgi:hypothetical protein